MKKLNITPSFEGNLQKEGSAIGVERIKMNTEKSIFDEMSPKEITMYVKDIMHENRIRKETPEEEWITCCICGEKMPPLLSNDPYPVRTGKQGCCPDCIRHFVSPTRRALAQARRYGIPEKQLNARLRALQHTSYEGLLNILNGTDS